MLTGSMIQNKRRVVLLLYPNDTHYCMELSAGIADEESTHFTLGMERNVPHITLVATELPESRDSAVWEIVQSVARHTQAMILPYTQTIAVDGWICAMTECTSDIMALHEALLDRVNDVRKLESVQAMQSIDMSGLDARRQAYALRYGHSAVREFYDPHVTLTRLKNSDDGPRVAAAVSWSHPTICATAIALCESGEHGVCTRVLRVQEFQSDT